MRYSMRCAHLVYIPLKNEDIRQHERRQVDNVVLGLHKPTSAVHVEASKRR